MKKISVPDPEESLTAELGQARAREAALREILDLISQSRGDAAPVFDAVVHRAADLCGAEMAGLVLGKAGDKVQRAASHFGIAPEGISMYERGEVSMNPDISIAARAILTGTTIHVPDMMDTDGYRNGVNHYVSAVHDTGSRSQLFVPLLTAEGGTGCILLNRRQVRPFSPDEIALVEAFAAQAVIAIENARQFREVQTRLAREAATRAILEVISTSRDDDRPVFDAILQNATRLCGADSAALALGTPDGPHLTLAALWQWDNSQPPEAMDAFIADINRVPLRMDPALHVSAQAICGGKVVHLADVAQSEGYLSGERTFRSMVEDQGIRTILSVPLFDAMGALGAINLHRREVRLFSDDEIALVQSFAAQAVIAIENVRQFRELQTRLEREAATRDILSVISQSRDDDAPVFDVIVRSAARLCNAQMAWLLLTAPVPHAFVLAGYHGLSLRQIELGDVFEIQWEPDSITGVGRAIHGAQTVPEEDLAQTAHYLNDIGDMRMLVDVEGIRSRLSVPLISGGVGIGAIVLTRREVAPFTTDQIALVETFAAQAVIAIQNVRQFRELQDSLEQQEATSDILRVISQSREDETQVFDLIVEKAAVLCDADQGSLQIVNEARTHVRLMADWGHDRTAYRLGLEFSLDRPLSIVATIRTATVVHIEDYSQSDAYKDRDPIAVDLVEIEGVRTRLIVPLLQSGIAIGCISLSRRAVRPFTPDEIALVETFAAQAVIAIENVRQFRELQTRLAREAATREILEVISQSRDDDRPVFDMVLRKAAQLCDASLADLCVISEDCSHAVVAAHWGEMEQQQIGVGDPIGAMDSAAAIPTCMREGRIVDIPDLADTDVYRSGDPIRVIAVEQEGIRTFLAVPLLSGGRAVGCIAIYRLEVRPFSADQIALVETFAAQAVIAIENVRQFRELQTRLAREAATREILEVISQSRDDDHPVFDAIVRNAARLCNAPTTWLLLTNPAQSELVRAAHHGTNPRNVELGSTWSLDTQPDRITGLGRAILEARTIEDEDLARTPLYLNGDRDMHLMVDGEGIRTRLSVPLVSGAKSIGAIELSRYDVSPFGADQIALVETFAAQAVIAIENVRQFRELQTRLAREAATREILEVISQSRDDDRPVFDVVLRKAAELCHASMAGLNIISEDRSHAVMVAEWGDHVTGLLPVGVTVWPMDSDHAPSKCMREGRIVHVLDLADTDLYRSGDPIRVTAVDAEGIRTFLAVPLFSGGKTVSCITIYRREVRPFTPDEITLVETFAAQAVIAIENVRQFRALQDRLAREKASAEILEVISQSRDDDKPVFDMIAQRAAGLCGASVCTFWRVEDGLINYCASHGLDSAATTDARSVSGTPLLDSTLTGQVVRMRAVARIEDATDESYFDHEWARERGLKQFVGVPIFVRDKVWGSIGLMWPADRAPRDADIQLVETFAAQASIAIENVRQFRELQDRLAREAATREILEVISRNPDNDRPVFDAILGNAIRLCGADTSALFLGRRDHPNMTLAAWRDRASPSSVHDDAMIATVNATEMRMDPSVHISAQVICDERKMQVYDILQSEGYLSGEPSYVIMADTLGVRTALFIPLIDARGALGVVHLHRREVRAFSEDEIALVETFAAQAVIAIENVRQFRELQDRLAREEATRQILQVISQSRDDETPVFDAILERAERLCDAPSSALLLVNEARSHLVLVATRGMRSSADIGETHPITSGHTSSDAVLTGAVAHVPDARDTELYRNGDPLRVELVDQWGVRTSLAVPLISNGEAIGAFTVMRLHKERPFSDNDIRLLEAFAAQAVIAIENVRQFRALEALNAELGDRVQDQVGEIERMGRLKRFLPAAVADAVVSSGSEKMLSSHRALLGVLFCDIRGFTAFCESAEPEETIEVLQTYHEEMGALINMHKAGVDHRMGDGIMVLFNDPLPCDDPAGDAVRLAMAMRARMAELCVKWKRSGYRLGFGLGVSLGYATVGMVGAGGRHDYTASGTAINLASRLCDEAQDGEILISPRAWTAIEDDFTAESRGEIAFKGIREPVEVFCVTGVV